FAGGGVAADGTIGQRGRGQELDAVKDDVASVHTPPPSAAVLPLTMQLSSVAVPALPGTLYAEKPLLALATPPPPPVVELPLMVQLVSVIVLLIRLATPPPKTKATPPWAELPLTVQLVSVAVPP